MIIYEGTKMEFLDAVLHGTLKKKIKEEMLKKGVGGGGKGEEHSWTNSLPRMGLILCDGDIPETAGVAVEYKIPHMRDRVDMIITGYDENMKPTAIIVELKQWSSVEKVEGEEGVVRTFIGSRKRDKTHPSYQAWSYARTIYNYNKYVQEEKIRLNPCAFLHNYEIEDPDPLTDPCYMERIEQAPLFMEGDQIKLRDFIKKHIRYGDNKETIYQIEYGELYPSKSLQDCIKKMITGNEEFIMIDDQKVVYEMILRMARESKDDGKKRVLIIDGGPGTGKSVLAINALAKLTTEGLVAAYVTKNSSPRNVYSANLKGTKKKTDIDNMFCSSDSFYDDKPNTYDIILADEAHRLNEKSGFYQNKGENQIKEIINASKFAVFFIDESQRISVKDIGTKDGIRHFAKEAKAVVVEEEELESQFRCDGSDDYIAWLEAVLQTGGTANFDGVDNFSYDIRIFGNPNDMLNAIKEKNSANDRSRLVAGYCWNWIKHGEYNSDVHDITIPDFGFGMSWNLKSAKTWAIDKGSINEIGCIHTCQGLEFDYVGVIIGDDLRYENGKVITDRTKRAKRDKTLTGLKKKYPDQKEAARVADIIIKNTYKTLMTRGLKGCYIYCTDKPLERYLEKMIEMYRREND